MLRTVTRAIKARTGAPVFGDSERRLAAALRDLDEHEAVALVESAPMGLGSPAMVKFLEQSIGPVPSARRPDRNERAEKLRRYIATVEAEAPEFEGLPDLRAELAALEEA